MLYQNLLKPILFQFDPESAHHLVSSFFHLSQKIPFLNQTLSSVFNYDSPRLSQKVAGIHFPNPVGLAAGFDKTAELFPSLIHMGFGSVEVGTVTAKEQPGNEKPRLFRYGKEKALINRMGFNNPGADRVAELLKVQKKSGVRGINAGKSKVTPLEESVSDYVYSFQKLVPYADYAVVNVSSPNTPGLRSLQSKEALTELITGIKKGFDGNFPVPLFLKLAPDLSLQELSENLELCLSLKTDGVILTNTTLDKKNLGPGAHPEGGLSGNPLFEKSLDFVSRAYQILKGRIPIIGVGGIDSGAKALQMFEAGANLIQIYTGYIYEGPFLPKTINTYLDRYMLKNNIKNIAEIVGNNSRVK
ncbi:quinone-dependent dihydroorotate dehydrogenase [Leptospira ilyithenensis]|uniref:Dihydroorotate dehydrogenase (quinone) n=1 Tax=Leptospira ilyithenensis TaxID=2484901 RepID=A0A4R9LPW1_9LEPT|nr:quinone-dependent dihydroorotate dehydrogenase [Leptospira ilyithenensis]TGN11051.1 quinone-dependent dihydroorotate dehydrogenase [Leptospira ilyithenensis]